MPTPLPSYSATRSAAADVAGRALLLTAIRLENGDIERAGARVGLARRHAFREVSRLALMPDVLAARSSTGGAPAAAAE